MAMDDVRDYAGKVINNVETVIIGKRESLAMLMVALLCEGHVLLEDVPGVGKTMLARALAASLDIDFKRLQCTPDLLPNDVTGVSIFDQGKQAFEFVPGPTFTNILLADEINRATPRTQSALLESMGERQVTVDGVTHVLERPFFVLATQNPVEFEGTFPLPEAQLDRFFMKLSMGYLDEAAENEMLVNLAGAHPIEAIEAVVDGHTLPDLARRVWEVHVDDSLRDYIVRIVFATRQHRDLALGASPRASHALYRGAQAFAALQGRDHILPDDVKVLAPAVVAHRCLVHPESALRGTRVTTVLASILDSTTLDIGEQ